MLSTVLPVLAVALVLVLCCWSIGSALLAPSSPLVALLCGWCVFLGLCTVSWVLGLSALATRPLLWAFFGAGLYLAFRQRRWADHAAAAACTVVVTGLLLAPFFRFPGLLIYGVNGTDVWGYLITAEWLQDHSLRQLPVIGVSPMRFNWTWHVLLIRDRPLNYQSLADLAAAGWLTPAKACFAYLVALVATLAAGLAREARTFGVKSWLLAAPPAIALAFHPIIILPWIAGFLGASLTGLCTALAFATVVRPRAEAERAHAVALAMLMLACCAGLYSLKFLYLALALGGGALLAGGLRLRRRRDLGPWRRLGRDRRLLGILAAVAAMAVVTLTLGEDQKVNTGMSQAPLTAAGHGLNVFGGSSPYVWMGYDPGRTFDRVPWENPVGLAALVVMTMLLVLATWTRWRDEHDLLIPLVLGLCLAPLLRTFGDEMIMQKALIVFGFATLVVLAAASSELRSLRLGLVAAVICAMPAVRSAHELWDIIYQPTITCTESNLADISDGQDWRILGYLHYREDRDGYDWAANPRFYHAITQFLPRPYQQRLADKYHLPRPE